MASSVVSSLSVPPSSPSSSRVTVSRVGTPGFRGAQKIRKIAKKVECSEGSETEVDISVFDMLNVLRRRLLVTGEEIIRQTRMASKDAEGLVDWVVLHPEFHSTLVKRALVLTFSGRSTSPEAQALLKRALFVFLLEVLNGQVPDNFFALLSGGKRDARAAKERRRLSVKRRRAAKREREHVAGYDQRAATSSSPEKVKKQMHKTCKLCSATFASRRQRCRHACPRAEEKASAVPVLDEAGPTNSPTPPALTDPLPAVSRSQSPTPPRNLPEPGGDVEATDNAEVVKYCSWAKEAGIARECENDASPATHVVMHGNYVTACYLKCERCAYHRGDAVALPRAHWW